MRVPVLAAALTLLAIPATARAAVRCLPSTVPGASRVCSPVELATVLRSGFTGQVRIPAGARWEMTDPCGGRGEFGQCVAIPMRELPLHSNVQLIGERGALASRPLLFTDEKSGDAPYPLFTITGNDVRIEGLHLRGPEAGALAGTGAEVAGISVVEDPARGLGRRVMIADNELDQWPDAAVAVSGTVREEAASAAYTGPRVRRTDAGLVRVERNYIHDNARDGLGYGVEVDGSAYVTIEGNV